MTKVLHFLTAMISIGLNIISQLAIGRIKGRDTGDLCRHDASDVTNHLNLQFQHEMYVVETIRNIYDLIV